MKPFDSRHVDLGAESGEDAQHPDALYEAQLETTLQELATVAPSTPATERARLSLFAARNLVALERGPEAWPLAREAFDLYVTNTDWENAVDACDVLFLADQPESLVALGHGVWLGVTYPIDPELTIVQLQHVIDETPDDADGAAVAAATANYIVELRATQEKRENLGFFTMQMLSTVARQHSNVEGSEAFEAWLRRLELDEPERFLVRLRNVVDVLVQDDWWIDRDKLHAQLPE